jgi:hypothetical protein
MAGSCWREAFRLLVRGAMDEAISGALERRFLDEPEEFDGLTRLLSDCTDIMPSALCIELEVPLGSTYAEAVESMKGDHPASCGSKRRASLSYRRGERCPTNLSARGAAAARTLKREGAPHAGRSHFRGKAS